MKKREKVITDLEPRGKSVLIKRIAEETKEGGVILPETSTEPRPVGIVVACGPDCGQDLKDGIGRMCSFNRYANLEIIDGNNNVLLMMIDSDVQCWINEDTTLLDDSGKKKKRINIDKK